MKNIILDNADPNGDPLWLEVVESNDVFDWVTKQNDRTVDMWCGTESFRQVRRQIEIELTNDAKIPGVSRHGDFYFNLSKTIRNPKGLWRRTSLEEYRKIEPAWENLLDFDQLAQEEGIEWSYAGAVMLPDSCNICLLYLSSCGSDACEVREFNIGSKKFVVDGYYLPISKSYASWVDENTLYVSEGLSDESLNHAGYPRLVRLWKRNEEISKARIIYEADKRTTSVRAYRDRTPGFQRDILILSKNSWSRELYLIGNDLSLTKVPLPSGASFLFHHRWLIVKLRHAWSYAGATWIAGTLLAFSYKEYMDGDIAPFVLFTPSPHTSLQSFTSVGESLLIQTLDNVKSVLHVMSFINSEWSRRELKNTIDFCTYNIQVGNSSKDDFLVGVSGFIQPPALIYADVQKTDRVEVFKTTSSLWDLSKYCVTQHFAISDDGTKIPYFQISKKSLLMNSQNPTLLTGYGGFQISMLPNYLGAQIPAWLERGGVYIVANIRGGGEYGPEWHQAALQKNREKAYEDFASVARSLFDRYITCPSKLGARGDSNGGLLIGNMLTRFSELFACLICEAPLLDMRRYSKLLAGASWIAEYGDPEDTDDWVYLRNISPYHNLRPNVFYPPTLFMTSTSDDRVSPGHARKMSWKMQEAGYSNVYFYESVKGGHAGALDRTDISFKEALISEFLIKNLKLLQ